MDKITETIAHFIGLFEIKVEQARLRKDYEEFQALRASAETQPPLPDVDAGSRAPFDFVGMDPGLRYQLLGPELEKVIPWSHVDLQPIPILIPWSDVVPPHMELISEGVRPLTSTFERTIDPPGSIAVVANQEIHLSDNDYVGAGGHGLVFSPEMDAGAELASLLHGAARLSPFGHQDVPASAEGIEDFILDAASALESFVVEHQDDGDVHVVHQETIKGSFVNGEAVDELPKLKDHLPAEDEEEEETPTQTATFVDGGGLVAIDPSVQVVAGENTLVNTALLTNNWQAGAVVATLGNYTEVNAIVQINVWSDSDAIGSSLADWTFDPAEATQAFNIATFSRVDPAGDGQADAALGGFPTDWVVTRIDGDLLIMNWIEQFSFMMDNDVHVLSSSGVKTMVTTGDNMASNDVSLTELGLYYDLIIVGGDIYDANFIHQMNVLLDDDMIGGVAGFHMTGEASLSTSGNLLWNSAEIVNIGAADRFEALPSYYLDTAGDLKAGKNSLSSSVLKDDAFSGLEGLRVLYISGSILDLQYIKQTNILGDSDQVALAMNGIEDSFPDADWTLSTGSNALINIAGITDLDSAGKTYVGGDKYSDEILIQAELISSNPELGGQDPDKLVNEAIAFLDDELAGTDDDAMPHPAHHDAPHPDVMQTMLA
ncbi:hypothetical protein [Aquamicrobium sp. LC103]|uniref:hypothetical protein n=1 Tax=Aquamicrobium sp. LC103 TaxID=1120658 RepID=UPI00063EA07B|nr:hypothetical protein [Aquamicrobium sp. LC103]TKT69304.1 type I secretion protein [Aquamicrobium sp. LC103]